MENIVNLQDCQGSNYDSSLQGWYHDSVLSQTTSTQMAEEKIWMNYKPNGQITFSDLEAGA